MKTDFSLEDITSELLDYVDKYLKTVISNTKRRYYRNKKRPRKYRQKVTVTTLFQTASYSDFQLPSQTPHVRSHSRKLPADRRAGDQNPCLKPGTGRCPAKPDRNAKAGSAEECCSQDPYEADRP